MASLKMKKKQVSNNRDLKTYLNSDVLVTDFSLIQTPIKIPGKCLFWAISYGRLFFIVLFGVL